MTKSRTLRKAGAVVLSLAMAFSVAATTPASAASKPSLKKTKVSVKVGKTVKVGIKNYKLVKKLTVSSQDASVAKAAKVGKKAVKITGVAAGTTKATATIKYKSGKKTKTVKKNIKITVKDTVKPVAKSISISDKLGLQSNGFGLKGDTLALSYGSEVGTPTSITWMRDDAIIATFTDKAQAYTARNGLEFDETEKVGKYWAVVTTDDKQTIKSNVIELTDVEAPAVIKSFTIEDDYNTGVDKDHGATRIAYNKEDNFAIFTLVMNRNYDGNIQVFEEADIKFAKPIGANTTMKAGTDVGNTAGKFVKVDTEKVLINENLGLGTVTGFVNNTANALKFVADDGTTTYKWVSNMNGAAVNNVNRGAKYIVTFDQDKIKEDTVGQGAENKSAAAEAPFVTVPSSIAITKGAASQKAEITVYDASSASPAWFGNNAAVGATFTVYEGTNNGVTTSSETKQSTKNAKKGKATMDGAVGAGTKYLIGEASFDKAIYGGTTDTKLATAVREVSGAGVDSISLSYDAAKAKGDIKVSAGSSFNTPGKVTLYRNKGTLWTQDSDIKPGECEKVAEKDVAKGDGSVTFEGAVTKVYAANTTATAGENQYAAVFTPSDEVNYTSVTSAFAKTVEVKATVVSYKLAKSFSGKTNAVTAQIYGVDQFGGDVKTGLDALAAASVTPEKKMNGTAAVAVDDNVTAAITFDATGVTTIVAKGSGTYKVGHNLEFDLPGGQKLRAEVTKEGLAAAAEWSLTVK